MSISASGLISGLDTNSIISQLLELQQQPIINLQQREAGYQVELTAYGSLRSTLAGLKSAMAGLNSVNSLTSFSASSGDTDIFTASAGSSATTGSYNITVEQLTQAHKLKSTAAFAKTEEVLEFKVDTNNKYIDFKEYGDINIGLTATLTEGHYTVSELEAEIKSQLETVSEGSGNKIDYTISYDSSTKKFTIKEDGSSLTQLDLLWESGTYGSSGNDKSAASLLGFDDSADDADAGVTSYTGDNEVGEGTIHLEIGNVFTIDSTNNKINFKEKYNETLSDELTATLDSGNYTIPELEKEIEDQLEDASANGGGNAVTYTVTYDSSTQKFDIQGSKDASFTDLQLLWKTGANGSDETDTSAASLLGFDDSADDAEDGVTSYTADSQVGVVTDISISATDTIEDVADAINDANAGVTATAIFDGTNYYLTLTAEDSGKANAINLTVTDIDGNNTDIENGLSRLVYHENKTTNLEETQDALDSIIYVDGVTVSRATNTIDDVIKGVTITLKAAHEKPAEESDTLTVSRNASAVVSKVNSFVSAYNSVLGFFGAYQSYDEKTKVAGILLGDSTTNLVRNSLRNNMTNTVPGVGSFNRLADLGITLNDEGKLEVNSSSLNSALDDHFDDVLQFFTKTTEGSEGFAVRMVDTLDAILNSTDGTLAARTDGIQNSIDDIQDKVERVERRVSAWETRTRAQFQALEVLLAQFQATGDYLNQQIAGLQNLNSYISSR
jgi:flagellar hook-associated protein 2